MVFTTEVWILFGISLLFCCVGYYRSVWFMSVGYGLSSAGIGAGMLVMSIIKGQFSIPFTLLCVLFIVYGFRLGGFLLIRQLKNAEYRKKMKEVGGEAQFPVFVAVSMWILCGALYVLQSAGAVYRFVNNSEANIPLYIGIAISAIGIILESIADKQKNDAKKIDASMPAMHGLYKMCRCPNYFGEILFWTGIVVSGIGAVKGAQWIMVAIGYIEIVFVMFSGAKRVETRHIKHYGEKEAYIKYADSTPLLFPLIPVYHMTNPEKIAKEEAKKAAKAEARKKKEAK